MIGAVGGVLGALLASYYTQRAELRRWRRDQRLTAYLGFLAAYGDALRASDRRRRRRAAGGLVGDAPVDAAPYAEALDRALSAIDLTGPTSVLNAARPLHDVAMKALDGVAADSSADYGAFLDTARKALDRV